MKKKITRALNASGGGGFAPSKGFSGILTSKIKKLSTIFRVEGTSLIQKPTQTNLFKGEGNKYIHFLKKGIFVWGKTKKVAFTLAENATHVARQHNCRKIAFTLAEVLITLAVIGVVAALTIPTLVQKHQEKVTVTKVKKFVSVMSQAIKLAEIDNGEIASWGFEPATEAVKDQEDGTSSDEALQEYHEKVNKFINIVKPYLKGVTLIDRTNNPNILDRYSLDGTKFRSWNHQLLFPDGTFLLVTNYSSNCSSKRGSSKPMQNICGELFYDVNGIKGPNATGKDVFLFYYTRYGVVPMGTEDTLDDGFTFKDYCSLNKKLDLNGYGCAAWVMYNENMDYLHCNDLSWDGKHKCD